MSRVEKSLILLLAFLLGYFPLAGCQPSGTGMMTSRKPGESVEPSSLELILVWEREGADGCHTVAINAQGQAQFGPCSGPLSTGTILSAMERPEDLQYFLDTFKPFEVNTPAGHIKFSGHGVKEAKASEQRAIGEWASIVYQELLYGRSGASWGMAIALNQEGDHSCQRIQLEIYGKVMANNCRKGIRPYPRMWLTAEQLDRLYRWIDRFQTAELKFYGEDGQPMRLVFGGKGKQAVTDVELKEMIRWIESIGVEALMLPTPTPPEGSVLVESEDGTIVAIAPGTTVQVEVDTFIYPANSPGAPEGTVWGDAGGRLVPLAPGVSIPLEPPQQLLEWPEANVPLPGNTISLDIPIFSQNDPAWKDNVMQTCGQTIGVAGSALSSTAMVFKYYGAINKNPAQLNTCLGNYACPIYWGVAASSCSEGKATWVGPWSFSYNKLQSMLSAGRPPIVELVKGGSTHFVVIRSGSGNQPSGYQINDPWDGAVKLLSDYTNNGWTPNSIREFARR
ncbi:MAG: hypothetical protein H5T61_09410 [Thermoflexales bacterium]|nr:hypothetical protein [Thermoflexales bacterium]